MTDISSTYVEQLRQEGNELFKSELFEGAIEKYSLALNSMGTETNVKGRNQKAILLSNRAACHIALERFMVVFQFSSSYCRSMFDSSFFNF